MSDRTFTALKQVYKKRALKRRKYFGIGVLLCSAVIATWIIGGGLREPESANGASLAVLFGGYCLYRVVAIQYGLRNFESFWQLKIDELSDRSLLEFEIAEVEILKGVRHFAHVSLTDNFVIGYTSIDCLTPITSLTRIDLEDDESRSSYGVFEDRIAYKLTCITETEKVILLSTSTGEMPDILDAIRLRHPDVELNPDARWRFFPPEGWQT
jgi:hypothetical protein